MKQWLLVSVIFFYCNTHNQLVVSDPYAILDRFDPEDTLVFDTSCYKAKPSGAMIEVWTQDGLETYPDPPGPSTYPADEPDPEPDSLFDFPFIE